MQRDQALAILASLPDDKILKALQVVSGSAPVAQTGLDGLSMGQSSTTADTSMGSPGNKIEPWSAKANSYGGGGDRPSLIDRMKAQPETNAQVPVQGGAVEGSDVYLQTGGM